MAPAEPPPLVPLGERFALTSEHRAENPSGPTVTLGAPPSALPPTPRRRGTGVAASLIIATALFAGGISATGCRGRSVAAVDAGGGLALALASTASVTPSALVAARIAADIRDPARVPPELAASPVPAARRASARALAQMGGEPSVDERLRRSLADEDEEVVAWSAYGLALPCDSDAELDRDARAKVVRALAARALTLEAAAGADVSRAPLPVLRAWDAIAWGLGRCGGTEASRELARWLSTPPERARAAAWALGSIANHERGLEDDVAAALVAAASGGNGGAPLGEALYPFGRADWSARAPVPRLAQAARAFLARSSPVRIFAIRAVSRSPEGVPADLRSLLAATDRSGASGVSEVSLEERVEVLRSLHRMGAPGDAEIAAFTTRTAPADDAHSALVAGPGFALLRTAVELLADAPTAAKVTVQTSLRAVLPPGFSGIPSAMPPRLVRRLATLRCTAAAALHPGAPADPELVRCAACAEPAPAPLASALTEIRDLARLAALDRGDVGGERRELLARLAREGGPRVRERALAILGRRAAAGEAADVMARALGARELGVVATAAEAIAERPSIVSTVDRAAIKAALDPRAPPPDLAPPPTREPDRGVIRALTTAIARPFEEADAEVEIALAAAVGALEYREGRPFLERLCGDRAHALRHAARRALARLDPSATAGTSNDRCRAAVDHGAPSPHASASPVAPTTVHFESDAGLLSLHLDSTFAPVAVARIAELARTGFYDGTPIHRVVPAFVVQLGDPGGDGYGGAHASLRCETAPTPFERLDIGVALAGRDTGSSQIFIMLARSPHLDGSYSWLGRAEGPWDAVAEGDLIRNARVE